MPAQRAARRASGPHDAITDVAGIRVGHWTHRRWATGCTVVICADGAVGGVDVRGAAPGTRETDLPAPRQPCRGGSRHRPLRRLRLRAGRGGRRRPLPRGTRHRPPLRGADDPDCPGGDPVRPRARQRRAPSRRRGGRARGEARDGRAGRAGLGRRRHRRDRRLAARRRARAQGRARECERTAR